VQPEQRSSSTDEGAIGEAGRHRNDCGECGEGGEPEPEVEHRRHTRRERHPEGVEQIDTHLARQGEQVGRRLERHRPDQRKQGERRQRAEQDRPRRQQRRAGDPRHVHAEQRGDPQRQRHVQEEVHEEERRRDGLDAGKGARDRLGEDRQQVEEARALDRDLLALRVPGQDEARPAAGEDHAEEQDAAQPGEARGPQVWPCISLRRRCRTIATIARSAA
jgi:hypothetical protein